MLALVLLVVAVKQYLNFFRSYLLFVCTHQTSLSAEMESHITNALIGTNRNYYDYYDYD